MRYFLCWAFVGNGYCGKLFGHKGGHGKEANERQKVNTPGGRVDRIAAERWIRSTHEAEEFAEKAVTQQASLECVARGYCDPAITFELGAIWQRRRHNPLCACGETSPGPCIRRYPEGHNAVKCTAPRTCQVCALAIEAPQGDEGRAKECQLCGSTIPASRLDRKPGSRPKYCSPQCYEKARRSRRQATVKAALAHYRLTERTNA